jgi:hypothetical protein
MKCLLQAGRLKRTLSGPAVEGIANGMSKREMKEKLQREF